MAHTINGHYRFSQDEHEDLHLFIEFGVVKNTVHFLSKVCKCSNRKIYSLMKYLKDQSVFISPSSRNVYIGNLVRLMKAIKLKLLSEFCDMYVLYDRFVIDHKNKMILVIHIKRYTILNKTNSHIVTMKRHRMMNKLSMTCQPLRYHLNLS